MEWFERIIKLVAPLGYPALFVVFLAVALHAVNESEKNFKSGKSQNILISIFVIKTILIFTICATLITSCIVDTKKSSLSKPQEKSGVKSGPLK
jgi:hypothetical protein